MKPEVILIVEDNVMNMELATDLLEASGYQVLQAESAEIGIEIAVSKLPSLILMDIALPGMDGLSAGSLLKRTEATCNIPIVALTAHAMKGDEQNALSIGFAGYITKPLDTRKFIGLIEGYL